MYGAHLYSIVGNFRQARLFTCINIAGLAVGLAASILIGLFVLEERSWDKHWRNGDLLYRFNTTLDVTGGDPQSTGFSALPARSALLEYFGNEIAHVSRVRGVSQTFLVGDQRFEDVLVNADPDLVAMLDFEVLAGNLELSLRDPASIALSATQALKYFGDTDVAGRELDIMRSVNQAESVRDTYRVGAVYQVPGKSVITLPAMALLQEAAFDVPTFHNWVTLDFTTLIQIRPGVDMGSLSARLEAFTNRHVTLTQINLDAGERSSDRVSFALQTLSDVYLDESFRDNLASGNNTVVMAFTAIAALVLLIACLNFTILSTARATQRAHEVALRKSLGAARSQLILHFLGEALLLVIPALLLSLVLVELLLPLFENMVNRDLGVDYTAALTWLSLGTLALLVALAGGLYPALVLSFYRPAAVLQGKVQAEGKGSISLRSALVLFQFCIATALMIATGVIWLQVQYSSTRDPGFDGGNVLVLDNLNRRTEVSAVKNVLKQEIAALPGVERVALSGHQPMQTLGYATMTLPHTLEGGTGAAQMFATLSVDADFFDTYRITLLAGRSYDAVRDQPTPLFQGGYQANSNSESTVVINTSTARLLGFNDPEQALGQRLVNTRGFNAVQHNFSIIGVVADTQFQSLRQAPRPEVYVLSPQFMSDVLSVRFNGPAQQVMRDIEAVWQRVAGGADMSLSFVEQKLAAEFIQERIEARLLVSFSVLAILIACLGLYGSAAFTVDRRTKEIGIRKVLGAEVREIITLLLWQFSKPVLLANVIAWPVALWAMLRWLQRFPYQIDAVWLMPLCILAGAIALSIAWLTVAGNTLKVATRKPVLALRYE